MKRILSVKCVRLLLKYCLSLFYDKQYLEGYYFDYKSMGWFWAIRGILGKLIGNSFNVPWPVHPSTIVSGSERIFFDKDDIHIFQVPGCYWQAHDANIHVGKKCYIAPNVGLITTNHDVYNPSRHVKGKDIVISDNCWIGMNSVILPGVCLGENTVVAAGSVVSKSFPDGGCVIGGVPAKVIRFLRD